MGTHPPVTVVVPTYNRGPRLRATLDAILASATDDLEAVEIIVVDDGSTPPAADALAGLEAKAPFAVRIVRQDNAGVGAARNRGFKEATGDTPIIYLQKLRVAAARRMLESHYRTVQEISEAVGYQDAAFFRSLFQRHTGSSPSAYQKSFGV